MAVNGMQMMLKSMGLGEAFEGVQKLVASGALDKVISFADEIGELNERIGKLETSVAALVRLLAPTDGFN